MVGLRQNGSRLEELLTAAEAANAQTRQRLRQSVEVLGFPSRDIHLTDKKLESGSYGGELTFYCDWRLWSIY